VRWHLVDDELARMPALISELMAFDRLAKAHPLAV